MSRLVEAESLSHTDLIFPCDCHDDHFLRLTWDDDDKTYRYLWITGVIRPTGIWPRLKAATRILVGKEFCSTEVVLGPESVESLATYLEALNFAKDES